MNRRKKEIVILSNTVDSIDDMRPSTYDVVDSAPEIQEWREIQTRQVAIEQRYLQDGIPRDPFVKSTSEWVSGNVLVLKLNGIISGGAIINDKIISEGKVVYGLTVKTIKPNEVILERNGREYSLTIDKPIKIQIRKQSTNY